MWLWLAERWFGPQLGGAYLPAHEKIYLTAVRLLGENLSPNAPDELGCADAVNQVVERAIGRPIGGGVSTTKMYEALKWGSFPSPWWRFVKIREDQAQPGDIIISPTGYGNGRFPGHVGIVGVDGRIMSNNSYTGQWEDNYSFKGWWERYRVGGHYPICYFRIIR